MKYDIDSITISNMKREKKEKKKKKGGGGRRKIVIHVLSFVRNLDCAIVLKVSYFNTKT